ncbi:hypothetical protein EGT74_15405 [Chitinophaga lutea]|uniref:Uncharacterized protein n=1 Tax=Chitinophaga lutea TaxID=2488634 RepID=A0A3N4Q9N9_9BACT|nr:hypothetical protein EGT74_15405 [Chitinophaga lutea]
MKNDRMKELRYTIDIWDRDYSLAQTTKYHIDNDSLVITLISGLKGESDKRLVGRGLEDSEKERIQLFLGKLDLGKLNDRYINDLIEDGDRKHLVIQLNNDIKKIEIANYYQKNIAELFQTINLTIGDGPKIKYKQR